MKDNPTTASGPPPLAQGRLTRWEGRDPDGTPRAVLAKRDGSWIQNMDEAMRKLARYEDEEERRAIRESPLQEDGGAGPR